MLESCRLHSTAADSAVKPPGRLSHSIKLRDGAGPTDLGVVHEARAKALDLLVRGDRAECDLAKALHKGAHRTSPWTIHSNVDAAGSWAMIGVGPLAYVALNTKVRTVRSSLLGGARAAPARGRRGSRCRPRRRGRGARWPPTGGGGQTRGARCTRAACWAAASRRCSSAPPACTLSHTARVSLGIPSIYSRQLILKSKLPVGQTYTVQRLERLAKAKPSGTIRGASNAVIQGLLHRTAPAHQMLLCGSPSFMTYWKDSEQSSSWARRNISRWLYAPPLAPACVEQAYSLQLNHGISMQNDAGSQAMQSVPHCRKS